LFLKPKGARKKVVYVGKMLGSGSGIKHPESATLHYSIVYQFVLNILAFFTAVF
jgi:hypothetical protein